MMQQINEAYETLFNLEKRKSYDSKIKRTMNRNQNKGYYSQLNLTINFFILRTLLYF